MCPFRARPQIYCLDPPEGGGAEGEERAAEAAGQARPLLVTGAEGECTVKVGPVF